MTLQQVLPRSLRRRMIWVALAGLGSAAGILAGGALLERARFGPSGTRALARLESQVRERVRASTAELATVSSRVAAADDLIVLAVRDPIAARTLFDRIDEIRPETSASRTGVTVYDAGGRPLAWTGPTSDLPRARVEGAPALFVSGSPVGPRLVRVAPIFERGRQNPRRLGTVVAEQLLSGPRPSSDTDAFLLTDTLAPVLLRPGRPPGGTDSYTFQVWLTGADPTGEGPNTQAANGTGNQVVAEVRRADLAASRARWRASVEAASLGVLAIALAVLAALLRLLQRQTNEWRDGWPAAAGLIAALVGTRLLLGRMAGVLAGGQTPATMVLLLDAGLLVTLVGLAIEATWGVGRLRGLRTSTWRRALPLRVGSYAVAGAGSIVLLWSYERLLQQSVASMPLEPLHFLLQPLNTERLATSVGLVFLDAASVWGAALLTYMAGARSRRPRTGTQLTLAATAWCAGALLTGWILWARIAPVPFLPLVTLAAATATGALVLSRRRRPMRRASQAGRVFGLYLALLIPAAAAYPSLHAFVTRSKEQIIEASFGPRVVNLRDDLQRQLEEALADIDRVPGLASLSNASTDTESPSANPAYVLWRQTALATNRLTSSIELYGATGDILSRFALNLPDSDTRGQGSGHCSWDVFEDVSHVLQASRDICVDGRRAGAIVVRTMLDYRTLPFIASQRPYFESPRAKLDEGRPRSDAPAASDVDFVLYGWSRAPIYVSRGGSWQLTDAVLQRAVESRQPFWATVTRDSDVYRAFIQSDRGGIYVLSYPVLTAFGHLMNLAELVILTAALYAAILVIAGVLNVIVAGGPAMAPRLLREVRSSFYRKLFLAFVAVAVIPAAILAVATRNRLARQFEANVNATAVKTVTVAQRLVEDSAALRPGGGALATLTDSHMTLVAREIDQDVNLYNGPGLQATSQRDLFASDMFPDRTPPDVYRRIMLDRLPTFVSVEDAGGFTYLLAAAPVRAGGSERIVTVPQTLQKQELEAAIADLDRRVWSAFVLFVMLGAGLGYWIAERIADPVSRLTRATRRIARGDLDARIAATSSDELRRLVDDFNRMADDLKAQRAELERTQRLEAWAEMARQVAHDIKNPLTPIQLSAEHARRVNLDRGRPLSPALDECVAAILTQVKLLRQISSEFSSFASSPTPRPESLDIAAVVEEAIESYRVGLAGRIDVRVTAEPNLSSVRADRTLFARALTNIVENALHAMPGRGSLAIALARVDTPQASIVITIRDTGGGMDPEALARIFEPYFSTRATGTGLGLTIAKRNIELNGGTIQVESTLGAGTTVTIVLPLAPAAP